MRYVYVVKSGSLNGFTNQYSFTPRHFSSKKSAEFELNQILEINRAKDVVSQDAYIRHDVTLLKFIDYIGEEGKYKGRVILEKHEMF